MALCTFPTPSHARGSLSRSCAALLTTSLVLSSSLLCGGQKAQPPSTTASPRRTSSAVAVVGKALTVAGLTGIAVGIAGMVIGTVRDSDPTACLPPPPGRGTHVPATCPSTSPGRVGYLVLMSSITVTCVGLPLRASGADLRNRSGEPAHSVRPSVRVGPNGVSLHWSFSRSAAGGPSMHAGRDSATAAYRT